MSVRIIFRDALGYNININSFYINVLRCTINTNNVSFFIVMYYEYT
jgi:hypothetical protein